jgi:hypothetical protein
VYLGEETMVKYLMALQRAIGRLIAYVFRRKADLEELKASVNLAVDQAAAKVKKTIDDV